jgi:hypothetical protein
MSTKHWLTAALSLLAAGLLYVHTSAAPVPEPAARGQAGRYTLTRVAVTRTSAKGRTTVEEHQALFDTSTGRLWVLAEQDKGKAAKLKWDLLAEAPK